MTDDRTPSPDSAVSATLEGRSYTKTEKMGCNAMCYFGEKLNRQIHRVRTAWDEAEKLRAYISATNATEAEFLSFVNDVENIKRLAK
jgi:hypothetical protein